MMRALVSPALARIALFGLLLAAAVMPPALAGADDCEPGTMITIAGDGVAGYRGEGGPAAQARLHDPSGIALAADGSVYLADRENHRVCKVDAAGVITTVAGDGWKDHDGHGRFAGDGGPAAQASLDEPRGLAVAADGSLYIADSRSHRIRKVDPAGIITTVAGDGWNQGASGRYAGDGGPAVEASLNWPHGIALAADGSLYIGDTYNDRVRRVGPNGTITTVAGTDRAGYKGDEGPATEAFLSKPRGLAVAPDGSIYLADAGSDRIRKVDAAGTITTVAGAGWRGRYPRDVRFAGDGGDATEAQLNQPADVSLAADGSLYIADMDNHRIRKVDPAGIITTIAGSGEEGRFGDGGPASEAGLRHPSGVAVSADGSVLIGDSGNHRACEVGPAGIIGTLAGCDWQGWSGDGGLATKASFDTPQGLALGADGSVYVTDTRDHRVRRIAPNGIIATVAGSGPWGLDDGGYSGDGGPATEARLDQPSGVAAAPDGSIYIADTGNHRIRKVDAQGTVTTVAGRGPEEVGQPPVYPPVAAPDDIGDGGPATEARLRSPSGVAVGADGSLYIADTGNHRIRRIDAHGVITTVAGSGIPSDRGVARVRRGSLVGEGFEDDGGPALEARLRSPSGVVVGADGSLYIADWGDGRVCKIDPAGTIVTVAGSRIVGGRDDGIPAGQAALYGPQAVAVGADGSVYIAESRTHRVRKVDLAGIITTVAGDGWSEGGGWGRYTGDGGPATKTSLYGPAGIAFGRDGGLYIVDMRNRRIRKVCGPLPGGG